MKYKPVLVHWKDACGFGTEWHAPGDEKKEITLVDIHSVGFIYKKTRKFIYLVGAVDVTEPHFKKDHDVTGDFIIPRSWVEKIYYLTEDKKDE